MREAGKGSSLSQHTDGRQGRSLLTFPFRGWPLLTFPLPFPTPPGYGSAYGSGYTKPGKPDAYKSGYGRRLMGWATTTCELGVGGEGTLGPAHGRPWTTTQISVFHHALQPTAPLTAPPTATPSLASPMPMALVTAAASWPGLPPPVSGGDAIVPAAVCFDNVLTTLPVPCATDVTSALPCSLRLCLWQRLHQARRQQAWLRPPVLGAHTRPWQQHMTRTACSPCPKQPSDSTTATHPPTASVAGLHVTD